MKDIFVVGVFADHSVTHTVKGALNRGYHVTLIAEGLGAKNDQDVVEALADLKKSGAQVISIDDFLGD